MPNPVERCADCQHAVEYHRSTGCLWRMGACTCPHDMRGQAGDDDENLQQSPS
jgi:hypothetical protein